MSIYVISPEGKPHGPFPDIWKARDFGTREWPGKGSDERAVDPEAWEISISTKDQRAALLADQGVMK